MADVVLWWHAILLGLFILFLASIYTTEKRKLYLLYLIFGMVFGLYFDFVSVTLGYYSYPDLLTNVSGIPLTMTIAEGFAIAITIRIYEALKGFV